MDPAWLFPLLAAGFGLAGLLRWQRSHNLRSARAWLTLALMFGLVSLWLLVGR